MRNLIFLFALSVVLSSCASRHSIVDPIETRYKFDCIPITVSDSLNEFKGGTRAIVSLKIYLTEINGDSLGVKVTNAIPQSVIIFDDNNKTVVERNLGDKPMPKFVLQVITAIKQCNVTIEHYNEHLFLKSVIGAFTVIQNKNDETKD